MNVEECYQEILKKLKSGMRPLVEPSPVEIDFLAGEGMTRIIAKQNLLPILAIINHTRREHSQFENLIIKILQEARNSEVLVFALTAFQKHIIVRHQKRGERIKFKNLKILKTLLQHHHPQVVEWTLRTIEQLGMQATIFKNDLHKIRPGPLRGLLPGKKKIKYLIGEIFKNLESFSERR